MFSLARNALPEYVHTWMLPLHFPRSQFKVISSERPGTPSPTLIPNACFIVYTALPAVSNHVPWFAYMFTICAPPHYESRNPALVTHNTSPVPTASPGPKEVFLKCLLNECTHTPTHTPLCVCVCEHMQHHRRLQDISYSGFLLTFSSESTLNSKTTLINFFPIQFVICIQIDDPF